MGRLPAHRLPVSKLRPHRIRSRLVALPGRHPRQKIRERNRQVYRIEVGQPGVKWRMFQEQCRKEQRGLACLENKAMEKPAREVHIVQSINRLFVRCLRSLAGHC